MKKLDENVYNMSGPVFNDEIKMLFDMEEKLTGHIDSEKILKKDNKKKNIAIIYDVDGWAFSNIAKEIKKYLSKDFNIDIFPVSVFDDNAVRMIFLAEKYDLVHCLWRGLLSSLDNKYVASYIHNMGMTKETFIRNYFDKVKITTSVYDHKFLDEKSFENTRSFAKYARNYTVSSSILKDIYDNLEIDKKPMMVISDGIDLNKFKPINLERLEERNLSNRKIKIGWVGNSEFTDSDGDSDLKGVRKIIKPALQELIDEGYSIEIKFADRKYGYIPHEKMPDYYNSIDLYVCASKNEGTPNPVLESMASGIPIISTDVGIVRDAFGTKQSKLILKERSKEALKQKMKELLEDKSQFDVLSKENLNNIKNWSWEEKCKQFKKFFEKNL